MLAYPCECYCSSFSRFCNRTISKTGRCHNPGQMISTLPFLPFAGLTNCSFFQCNLDYFTGRFDIGISLHACGIATDLVLKACLDNQASFVSCPCCYGSLAENHVISYPKSQKFQQMNWSFKVRYFTWSEKLSNFGLCLYLFMKEVPLGSARAPQR